MSTDHPHPFSSRPFPSDLHPQIEATCKDLNMRIARLALALGLSLDDEADMARVMHHHTAAEALPGDHPAFAAFGSSERRVEQTWTELRGLIVLRDELEKHCVEAIGASATSDILMDIEKSMPHQGFKPGADGVNLLHLLGIRSD